MLGKHKSLQNPIAGMIKILQFARRNGLAGPILLYQKHFIKCKGREENPWAWQIHFIFVLRISNAQIPSWLLFKADTEVCLCCTQELSLKCIAF